MSTTGAPFLRIPPFPRHRAAPLGTARRDGGTAAPDIPALAAMLRAARVGGRFWGRCEALPARRDVLLSASTRKGLDGVIEAARKANVLARACIRSPAHRDETLLAIDALADPWAICAAAGHVIADAEDETALVAALLGRPLTVVGNGRFTPLQEPAGLEAVLERELAGDWAWRDPFTGCVIAAAVAIAMLAQLRRLIDANRAIATVEGLARWKRVTADAMLWGGDGPVPYEADRRTRTNAEGQGGANAPIALAWVSRSRPQRLEALTKAGFRIGEIEDGMIRSNGLGANCVPPLSIVVDMLGPHFDPAQASTLETILQYGEIGPDLCTRAAALRARLVGAGISKYGCDVALAGSAVKSERNANRRTVLVTGQVEDDQSVLRGAPGLDNLALLRRARAEEPDAYIIFKPHPDVEAGHRKGRIPDVLARELADEIDRTTSIAALLASVDAVHVLTSLAGFEALMRGRTVTTHGVPFYAGWGLTTDLAAVPARRARDRTLDELVAATLIVYPRYLDPVTRLPCEPETLVDRIAAGKATVRSPLITLREAQGRLRRLLPWGAGA